jgi:glyoxylase I family protein
VRGRVAGVSSSVGVPIGSCSGWLGVSRAMVADLERTRRFYADALGLELDAKEGYLLGTLPKGAELLFFEGEAVRGTSPQIVFGLDEGGIDTAVEALAARGVQLLTPVTEAPGGWSVELCDPERERSSAGSSVGPARSGREWRDRRGPVPHRATYRGSA